MGRAERPRQLPNASSTATSLLLPRDMEFIRHIRQPDLFMSLKRDLAMVSCIFPTQVFKINFLSIFFIAVLIIFAISM